MKYLYGNSTESNLDQNYLDFLRRAIDFCVAVLQSETRITALREQIEQAKEASHVEEKQLAVFVEKVDKLLASATSSDTRTTIIDCRDNLQSLAHREFSQTQSAIAAHLNHCIESANRDIRAERMANLRRLEDVVRYCDLPDTKKQWRLLLNENGRYTGTLSTDSCDRVKIEMGMEIPSDSIFIEPVRVDQVTPELQVSIPDTGGWLKRESKISLQKLNKEYVHEIRNNTDCTVVELRSSPKDSSEGFTIQVENENVQITRVSKQQQGTPYLLKPLDAEQVRVCVTQLSDIASILANKHRRHIEKAFINNIPLVDFPDPEQFILWLLEKMVPVVKEISKNTLSPKELVLKRVLSDDRREEIFASKADLLDKLTPLTPPHKQYFAPLGLNVNNDNLNGLPTPTPSRLDDIFAPQTPASFEPMVADEPIVVESTMQSPELAPEESTAEIDLEEIDEPPSASPVLHARPSTPPPRPSTAPPPKGASVPSKLPPPRPSAAPGASTSRSQSPLFQKSTSGASSGFKKGK